MAEQVVDIRQRIERMRTQIDDGASPSEDNSKPNEKIILKKGNLENQKDLKPSNKNTNDNFLKKSDSLENKKTEFDGSKVNTPNFKNVESLNENIEKKNDENLQSSININQKEKTESKNSFENYQLKNTVDSQNKKVEFDKVTEKFPQFSLNINNPISWKLMLLIMLMQLLTNIMLVVVLYLK